MIIWLNGAFGAGKTTAAHALYRRYENGKAFIFDPEETGFFLRGNLPSEMCTPDFQDIPLWRSVNFDMIHHIANSFQGDVIIPMTITNKAYFDALPGRLADEGHRVEHFILAAPKEEILKRNRRRLCFENSWPARQADRCIAAFDTAIPGHKIDTYNKPVHVVVDAIAAYCGVPIAPERRKMLRRGLDSVMIKLSHIRL